MTAKAPRERHDVLAEVAERVALLNEARTDDFQDEVARAINDAREVWRGDDGELPGPGADPAFEALGALLAESDGSPEEVNAAVERARHAAEEMVRTR